MQSLRAAFAFSAGMSLALNFRQNPVKCLHGVVCYPFGDVNHTRSARSCVPEAVEDGCVKTPRWPLKAQGIQLHRIFQQLQGLCCDSLLSNLLRHMPTTATAGSANQTHTAAAQPITSSSSHISIVLPAVWCATSALQGHIFLQGGLAKLTRTGSSHAFNCAGPTCSAPSQGTAVPVNSKTHPSTSKGAPGATCCSCAPPWPSAIVCPCSHSSACFAPAALLPAGLSLQATTPTSSTQDHGPGRQDMSRSSTSHVLETRTISPVVHSIHTPGITTPQATGTCTHASTVQLEALPAVV